MTDKSMKVIAIGDVEGKFAEMATKLTAINSKYGPFDMALCVGDFFGSSSSDLCLLNEQTLSLPIPVYFITEKNPLPRDLYERSHENHGQICPNLTYLGRKGLFTTENGLRIAFLSGLRRQRDEEHDFYTNKHLDALLRMRSPAGQPPGVDILLTNEWADSINNLSSNPYQPSKPAWNVTNIAKQLCPRYHFSAVENTFYEREPYKNGAGRVTRFIGLAHFGNTEKKRWFYAANVVPMKHVQHETLNAIPKNATESPFNIDARGSKRDNYFYDDDTGKRQKYDDSRQRRKDAPCWFCLSNPDLEKHLIVSVGSASYLTLAKGEFTQNHLLLVPIDHIPNTRLCPPDLLDELNKYLGAVKGYYESLGFKMLLWETNFRSQHLNLQMIPIPAELIETVESKFMEAAEEERMDLKPVTEVEIDPLQSFLRIEFPSGNEVAHTPDGRFNMQFCRETLAMVFNTRDRADWKSCVKTEPEETQDAKEFREKFSDFEKQLQL